MALASPVLSELRMVRDTLASVPAVEQVYAQSGHGSLSILVVMADKNPDAQRLIFDKEAEIIDAFPWLEVDLDIVFRCGRQLKEIVSPRGTLLFAR